MRAHQRARGCLRRVWRARLALAALVVLLGAGVFLGTAYEAWADDVATGGAVDVSSSTDETSSQAAPDPPPETAPPETTPEPAPPSDTTTGAVEVVDPPSLPPVPPVPEPPPGPVQPHSPGPSHPAPVLAHHAEDRPAEVQEGAYATIWLKRSLPDPLPPAARLSPRFARQLLSISSAAGARWSDVLAVARSRGAHGSVPLRRKGLERLSARLAEHPHGPLVALAAGHERLLAELRALSRYNRAVGLAAFVRGLEAVKPSLARRVLRDERIDIYAAGRPDIASGGVDVRVLVLLRYLAIGFHQVSVTSLITGHRLFARPGVVSAHVAGLAADIGAIGRTPVSGHQSPGGITERAIEAILLLPGEVHPQQVISLIDLGGSSFALADHYDHIHVGF
jgi:hypothetical protein